jgi:hypothetical protein
MIKSRLLVIMALQLLCTVSLSAATDRQDKCTELPLAIGQFFEHPVQTFKDQRVPKGFRIIVLSNLAEASTNIAISEKCDLQPVKQRFDCLIKTALSASVALHPQTTLDSVVLDGNGLYLSHLNIILNAYKRATGLDTYAAQTKRISRYLTAKSVTDPYHCISSYAGERQRWPADQCATLHSLYLFDANFSDSLSIKPIAQFLDYLTKKGYNQRWKLPFSELTAASRFSIYPRGCALSWMVRYMGSFAPQTAEKLWIDILKSYKVEIPGFCGMREWPPGIDLPADDDSGPILYGIGTAASGLGLAAASVISDRGTFDQLHRSGSLVRMLPGKQISSASKSIVSSSIEWFAQTYVPWFAQSN